MSTQEQTSVVQHKMCWIDKDRMCDEECMAHQEKKTHPCRLLGDFRVLVTSVKALKTINFPHGGL